MAVGMIITQKGSTPLNVWADAHQPAETLFYKEGYSDQILFVRDKIPTIFARSFQEYSAIRGNMDVISEHVSKSVRLPVFLVKLADGTTFIMRYNFHDWKVSVSSPRDAEADFMGLFDQNKRISYVYCEGFPKELVFGSYAENKRQFTFELGNNETLYTFFWIFAYQVLGIRKKD